MIYIIFPEEESTLFLYDICSNIEKSLGKESFSLIKVTADEQSYQAAVEEVKSLPENSFILFIGHGHSDKLYGVLSYSDIALFDTNTMHIFAGKNLFAVACNSSILLRKAYNRFSLKSSIGFGDLPTDTAELEIKKFKKLGVNEKHLEQFKVIMVEVISEALIGFCKKDLNVDYLFSYLKLLLNKKISEIALEGKNRILAELVFQMRNQLAYIKK